MADSQAIQAGHGVATFVPAGRVIKIVHNSELQSIDIWAFVLSKPEVRHPDDLEKNHPQSAAPQNTSVKGSKKKNVKASDLPSQDDAEKATKGYLEAIENKPDPPKKNTWASYVPTSYVPSLSFSKKKDDKNAAVTDDPEEETEQQKNSRTWASYIPTGKGFRSYIPDQAKDTLSDFAKSHQRDPSKPYFEQLRAFSNTPVGAASLSALTGTGYAASLNAGYHAWSTMKQNQGNTGPVMEYMSMSHTRGATCHLTPQVHDLLSSNLGEPVLTVLEDTSANGHDSLTAACMPVLGSADNSGSSDAADRGNDIKQATGPSSATGSSGTHTCAENLVLALGEMNTQAKLPGSQAIGAAVSVHNAPPPLRLFRGRGVNAKSGVLRTKPSPKQGADDSSDGCFVRLRAERDLVMVMSACIDQVSGVKASGNRMIEAYYSVEDAQVSATKQRGHEAEMRKSNAHAQKAAALKLQDTKKPPMKIISNATKSTTSQNSTGESTPQSSISKLKVGSATVSDGANKLKTSKISKAETASEAKVQGTGINKRYSQQDTPDHGTARPVTRKGADAGGSPSKEKKKPRKIVRPSAKAQQT